MAKIPLRAYVKEIENLIGHNEIEQAIAHAKNILRVYPKHIDTYRVLGQAYHEGKRYGEAADIFQRVLAVIPDDFVANIGLSIIREDEQNLDSAIWHMERAYEVQPFNPAVQEDLRRLYGKRDGSTPPKIRLTRGALVRMYMRGELYPQAIAEAQAALLEDPERYDLLALLAQLYALSGQKLAATEACSTLIGKLPYCYEANRILAQILPETSRAEDATRFQQRVYALNPYVAFIGPGAETLEQVPDQAVLIEPFTWDPMAAATQAPTWAQTIGMEWGDTEEEALPDWISGATEKPAHAAETLTAEPDRPAEDVIPDWMKEAGWTPGVGSEQAPPAMQPDSLTTESPQDAAPAEIPDWLQALAPQDTLPGEDEEEQRSDWLENLLGQPGQVGAEQPPIEEAARNNTAEAGLPDCLSELADAEPHSEPSTGGAPAAHVPDAEETTDAGGPWVVEETDTSSGSMEEQTAAPLQQWLSSLPDQPSEPGAETALPDWMPEQETDEQAAETALPDWMQEHQETSEPASETVLPEWMQEQETTVPAAETTLPDWTQEQASAESALPDWMQEIGERSSESEPSGWVQKEEQLAQGGETSAETTLPDWLAGVEQEIQQPVIQAGETAAFEHDQPLEGLTAETEAPDLTDMDAALAWLEALAARQGADEATLTIESGERSDEMPDWMQQQVSEEHAEDIPETVDAAILDEAQATSTSLQAEIEATESEDALPDWLAQMQDAEATQEPEPPVTETAEEITEPPLMHGIEEPATALPDWMQEDVDARAATMQDQPEETAGEPTATEQTIAAADLVEDTSGLPDFNDMEATMAWMEGLAERQRSTQESDAAGQEAASLLPDWVAENMEQTQSSVDREDIPVIEAEAGATSAQEAELPDWLESMVEEEEEFAGVVASPVQDGEPAAEEQQIEQQMPVEAKSTDAPGTDEEMPDVSAMSDEQMFAWLESLAARQGTDEGELLIAPEERPEPVDLPLAEDVQEPAVEIEAQAEVEEEITQEVPVLLEEPASEESNPLPSEAEIPDWLRSIEREDTDLATPWQTTEIETTPEDTPDIPASMPEWLANVEEEQQWSGEETVPEWLRGIEREGELAEEELPIVDPEPTPGSEQSDVSSWEAAPLAPTLEDARTAYERGDLQQALQGYERNVHEGKDLPEIIKDLRDALYRYPVDISLWQLLGDAYARNEQLQEAIDAYTKAEELLR